MHFSKLAIASSLLALTSTVQCKVILIGDSTSARTGANDGYTAGWGATAQKYFSASFVNQAHGGASARSYYNTYFDDVANTIEKGDIVIIELGHNDGGSPTADSTRPPASGTGSEIVIQTNTDGTKEQVHTFPWYLYKMANVIIYKGGKPIISSQTPNGPDQTSTSYAPSLATAPRFVSYAKIAVDQVGSKSTYVDHFSGVVRVYSELSLATLKTFFPKDHTHTSPAAAEEVARAFIAAAKCDPTATSWLAPLLSADGQSVAATC